MTETWLFYVVVERDFGLSNVAVEIRKALGASIVKLEIASRKLFSKPVQTVNANCKNSSETAKRANVLRCLEGAKEHLEDDVRLSMRHFIKNVVS